MTHEPSVPDALSDREMNLLGAYRTARAMPSDVHGRVRRRLAAAAAVRGGSDRVPDPRLRWIVAGFAVAAAAMLVVWAVGQLRATSSGAAIDDAKDQAAYGAAESEPGRAAERMSSTPSPRAGASVTPEVIAPRPESASEPAPEPASDEATPAPAVAETVAKTKVRSRTRTPPAAAEPTSARVSLDEERELLARAWAALADERYDDAVAVTKEHTERFPSGVLKIERRAIAMIVACKKRSPGWPKAATSFDERYGDTPVARQVREACSLPAAKKTTP